MVGNLLHLWLVFVTCTVCITFMVDFYYISITFMDDYYIYGWYRLSVQWNSVAQLILTAVFKRKTEIVISNFFGMLLSKTNMKNSLTTKETISFYGLKDGKQGLTCKL